MEVADVISLRRRIHAHPEPGFLEFHTAWLVLGALESLDVSYRLGKEAMDVSAILDSPSEEDYEQWGQSAVEANVPPKWVEFFQEQGTAIVAILKGNRPGPVWGLRCDMDALPIHETESPEHLPNREGFRSRTSYMHACGHDGHVASGIALASQLSDSDFPGELRILFQPAEEGVRGATPMLAAGATDGIERMLAVHLVADLPVGSVVGGADDFKATTKWKAVFTGTPAHAAGAPEKGRHAIAAAAHATLGIQGITRYASTDTRVNVGTFHASGSAGIIPAKATITYEVRATENNAVADMGQRAENIVHGAAKMYGLAATTHIYGSTSNSLPDDKMLDLIEDAASEVTSISKFSRRASLGLGSDDAHLLIQDVQKKGGLGSYILVGAQSNDAPHHNSHFDIDEAAISTSIDLLEAIIRSDG